MGKSLDIFADLDKKLDEAITQVALETTEKIEIAFERTVEDFYNDYDNPVMYQRSESTYMASDHWAGFGQGLWEDFLNADAKSFDGRKKIAGITIDGGRIPAGSGVRGTPYWEKDPSKIFIRTFSKGIHGYTSEEARKYKLKGTMPPKMSPSPKKKMDDEFKKICGDIQGDMDKAISKVLNSL